MILLDPDLGPDLRSDPDPDLEPNRAPYRAAAKRETAAGSSAISGTLRLPSQRTLARFLGRAQAEVGLREQVTVLLTTDAAIRRLNRRFRGKDKPTDILSFPADGIMPGSEKIAGDLAIGIPTARRQATEQGHRLATEIKVLMLHGLLHLAGYDHETDAGQMARRERLLRNRLGLPLGLIERAGSGEKHRKNALRENGARKNEARGVKPTAMRRRKKL